MMRVTISRTNNGYLTENTDGENSARLCHVGFSSLSEHLRKTFGDQIPEPRNEVSRVDHDSINRGLNNVNSVLAERCKHLEALLADAQKALAMRAARRRPAAAQVKKKTR